MRRVLMMWMVVFAGILSPGVVSAQEWSTRELITTVVIALPLTTTSYAVERTINRMTDKVIDKIVTYLEENEAGIRHGLAVGGGETMDDLAVMCEVPQARRAAFVAALRARRGELDVWGERGVTREGASRFVAAMAAARQEAVQDER